LFLRGVFLRRDANPHPRIRVAGRIDQKPALISVCNVAAFAASFATSTRRTSIG